MAHDNDAIMAGGPHLRIAALGTADPEFDDIAPGGGISWTQNATQTVAITGTPTGGTFTLTATDPVTGATGTTATLNHNAAAAAVESALEALSFIGAGNVTVTGNNPTFTVTFTEDLAETTIAAMTGNGASLTGGTAPAVTVTVTADGYGYSEPVLFADEVSVAYVEKAEDFIPVYELYRTHDVVIEKGIDMVKSMIAQRSAAALQYALGAMTLATTAAGANQVGKSVLDPADYGAGTYYKAFLVLRSPAGGYFLLKLPKVRFIGDIEQKYGRKLEKTPIQIKCFSDDGVTYQILEQTADAAS